MNNHYDAIIIGAGVIGVCTGFELAKRGYRTVNVDKQPAAGSGSTCNTCAIIRLHYSTPDGCAMARESYFYWLDWGRYLGVPDELGLAKYVNTGCLVFKNDRNHDLVNVMAALDELHVAYEDLTVEEVAARFPLARHPLLRSARHPERRPLRRAHRRAGSAAPSTSPNPATSTTPRWPATTCSAPARPGAASSASAPRWWRS